MIRLLVPFTGNIDFLALDTAVSFAHELQATLLLLVLLPVTQQRERSSPRLEDLQQAQDFFEATFWRAQPFRVPLERYEARSQHLIEDLCQIAITTSCDGVLFFVRPNKDALCARNVLFATLEKRPTSVLVVLLPASPLALWQSLSRAWQLLARIPPLSWLLQRRYARGDVSSQSRYAAHRQNPALSLTLSEDRTASPMDDHKEALVGPKDAQAMRGKGSGSDPICHPTCTPSTRLINDKGPDPEVC